ncbi:MAG TPA: TIGR02266 family protein, partial [Myxococcaceae bacterium]
MTVAPKLLPLRIRLPYATEEEFVEKYGSNVGRGGVFVATRALKEEGTALAFEFVLADGTRMLRGEGVVVKAQVDEGNGRSGMTVRFVKLDAQSKAFLDRLVARRTSETGVSPEPRAAPAEPAPQPVAPPAPVPTAPPARVETRPAPPAPATAPGVSGGAAPSRLSTAPPPGLVRRTSPPAASVAPAAPAAPPPVAAPPASQVTTTPSRPAATRGPAEARPVARAPDAPVTPPEPSIAEAPAPPVTPSTPR